MLTPYCEAFLAYPGYVKLIQPVGILEQRNCYHPIKFCPTYMYVFLVLGLKTVYKQYRLPQKILEIPLLNINHVIIYIKSYQVSSFNLLNCCYTSVLLSLTPCSLKALLWRVSLKKCYEQGLLVLQVIGQWRGSAVLLCENINTNLTIIHCIVHS